MTSTSTELSQIGTNCNGPNSSRYIKTRTEVEKNQLTKYKKDSLQATETDANALQYVPANFVFWQQCCDCCDCCAGAG